MKGKDRLFATRHFLNPDSDLWRYSDALMHWDCYAKWDHRARFARMYFEAKRKWSSHNAYWGVAYSDDLVLITTNPDKPVGEVDVILADTGSGFRLPLADWVDWLAQKWSKDCHHEIEREALTSVIALLRSKLPTPEAIVAAAVAGQDVKRALGGDAER
jgi:hypothetical protein